jgi:hypothetical protein
MNDKQSIKTYFSNINPAFEIRDDVKNNEMDCNQNLNVKRNETQF